MARVIALVGGGTMGPTAPLLALRKKMASLHPDLRFVWIGTPDGPERSVVEALDIPFVPLHVAKFPRYLSWRWFAWPWDFKQASREAKKILDTWKPVMVIGAGGFSQVPVIRQAAKRDIPCVIHQLDFVPLLSNRLVARFCSLITVSFVYHHKKLTVPIFRNSFKKMPVEEKTIATPNRFVGLIPIERMKAVASFGLDPGRPVVLFVGGGTGSRNINSTVEGHLDEWLRMTQIIQLTGKDRGLGAQEKLGYVKKEFLGEQDMFRALCAADVVISRAGMGSITDLVTLSKPTILVPIGHSSQEQNARRLPSALIEVPETPDLFKDLHREVDNLLKHPEVRQKLAYEIHRAILTDDGSEWASLIERILPEEEK